jgi:23S rRNA (pseudouridine1915-N3)-methyltransferase
VERLKIIWPGKTKNKDLRALQEFYLAKIRRLESCSLIETREIKGLKDRDAEKIKDKEAANLEKYFRDEYIICLFDKGREMSSEDLARFLEKRLSSSRAIAFVVGGFAGLNERLLKRADFLLSLSRMTFSHELCRVVLLEQIYRALTIQKGRQYAK